MARLRMMHRIVLCGAGTLGAAIGLSQFAGALAAQTPATGVDALQKAKVLERLVEAIPPPPKGATAPGFVLDPAWPKPLPHNWIIGDIGGLAVDRRDHIWIYHRPRALSSTDSGAQGPAGQNERGVPISPIGFPRPYGQLSGCCMPAPSILEFDKAGNLIQGWGGPGDPGFLEERCRQADGCVWPAREHGIFVDHNDFVYVAGNGQAVSSGSGSAEVGQYKPAR
jgi:hypothetical protein